MSHSEPKSFKATLALSFAALGVVFGDIGTSVLYTFQECFHGAHPVPIDYDNVMGITSLILWSLIIVVTVKYVWIMMEAENKGEGGILSLLSLVPAPLRYNAAGTLAAASLLAVAGAALLFGDGIITPAISVLGAMEGLELANPDYVQYVVPGTITILFLLFAIQRTGTARIGKYFGSIILVWFAVIAFLGVRKIIGYPVVLRAFNPRYASHFFVHEGWSGIKVLGSVILAITGGEALYADMGHFGKKPIRIAWRTVVLPALMLNYLGQAALILQDEKASFRPFYSLIEGRGVAYYALILLATAAAIIASQALITGAFSLTQQAIRMGVFPRVKIIHTSEDVQGRVYIPFMNWLLAFSCIAIVLGFQKSERLAAAYGLAVSGTMLMTTLVFFFVAHYRWKWELWKVLPLVLFMGIVDIAFLYANLLKIPDGGYLPLMIGSVFFLVMMTWQYGRAQLSKFYRERSKTMDGFFNEIDCKQTRRIPGCLVVLASTENKVPPVLARLVDSMHVIHEHVVLVTVTTVDAPFVREDERVRVTDMMHNVSRVIMKYGFMEAMDVPEVLSRCYFSHMNGFPKDSATYLLGRETFIINGDSLFERARQLCFSAMSRNTTSASDYFNLPSSQVIELGAQLAV
ncbi:MAG: KUP/HAK/KT family potassium transporter [Cryobacterium sp.]|nr:KUP/HAK/KT family potassium transporter [Oligoflexia bacterium]